MEIIPLGCLVVIFAILGIVLVGWMALIDRATAWINSEIAWAKAELIYAIHFLTYTLISVLIILLVYKWYMREMAARHKMLSSKREPKQN